MVFEEQARRHLKFLEYAPILFVSATTGKNSEKIFTTLAKVASERRKRISTGQMNRFLRKVDFERASVPAKNRVKIYYMTQGAVSPPTFIIFTDRDVPAALFLQALSWKTRFARNSNSPEVPSGSRAVRASVAILCRMRRRRSKTRPLIR